MRWKLIEEQYFLDRFFATWKCSCGKLAVTGGDPPSPCVCTSKR